MTDKKQKDGEEEKLSLKKEVFSYIKLVIGAIVIAFLLTHFVIVNAIIPSGSMENTIMTHSRVIGSRLSYLTSDPQRGDIVIFRYPVDESVLYIKRVIGLPGETVEIKDGKIYIDGSSEALEEDYLPEDWVIENDGYTFQVPEDSYLMLGDNRNVSLDARFWAGEAVKNGLASTEEEASSYTYVKKDKILAKAFLVYWPLSDIKILKKASY
jgi:signal peptidase I